MNRNEEITLSEPTVYGWLETMYGIRPEAPSPVRQPEPEQLTPAFFNDGIADWLWNLYGIAYPAAARPRRPPEPAHRSGSPGSS